MSLFEFAQAEKELFSHVNFFAYIFQAKFKANLAQILFSFVFDWTLDCIRIVFVPGGDWPVGSGVIGSVAVAFTFLAGGSVKHSFVHFDLISYFLHRKIILLASITL